jgi:hypothetical protein
MIAKDKMFKITSVIMESGCKKFILYRNFGWGHLLFLGSRYGEVGKFDSLKAATTRMDELYQNEANSCIKSKEIEVWPKKEKV